MNPMEWLNYHHLLYFWTVAREGGLVNASRALGVSHPTVSAQIHALEAALEKKLFAKEGRRLVLTDDGRLVMRYADEIFSLGRELMDSVRSGGSDQPLRLNVGVADVVPKLLVRRLLDPALRMERPVRMACYEESHDRLLAQLALHALHVVISDSPVPPGSAIRAYNHLLGECGVTFFAAPELARRYAPTFPQSLDGAPMLLPHETLPLRRALNLYFARLKARPSVVAEFEDSALFKVFGADGVGLFPAPTVIEDEVTRQYGVEIIGRADAVRERFYAITAERRLSNPAVVAITEAGREGFSIAP